MTQRFEVFGPTLAAFSRSERRTSTDVAHLCNLGNTLCKAFTFRVSQGSDAGAGDGVDAAGERNNAGEYRSDDLAFDRRVIRGAAFQSVAVTLDQPRALGDFERQCTGFSRGRRDEREPGLDCGL